MKAMISQPMRGKSKEQVCQERAETIKQLEAQGCEVVDTVSPDFTNQGNVPLKYLAKNIEVMADVDFVYFMSGWDEARGCRIEYQCCKEYGIPIVFMEGSGNK
jgi:Asp-tRNA(Asn)/Glu-tRNA(Gln) amidotransferase A subunit family amidase